VHLRPDLVDPCRNAVSFRVKEYFKEIGGMRVPKAEFLENLGSLDLGLGRRGGRGSGGGSKRDIPGFFSGFQKLRRSCETARAKHTPFTRHPCFIYK
jgi:hypothetical protein